MSLARLTARTLAALTEGMFLVAFHGLKFIPAPVALSVARPLGCLLRLGTKNRVRETVTAVLGSDSVAAPDRFDGFWRAYTRHVGLCVLEPIYFHRMTDEELLERVELEGEHHLTEALQMGRGAVLLVSHLGNPGAIVAGLGIRNHNVTLAGNGMDISIGGEVVPLNRIEATVQRMFERGRMRRALLGGRLPRILAATLKDNGVFAMFIDFPVVRRHCREVRFGHAPMAVNLGPAVLALRHHAPVLPIVCVRTNSNRHHLTIHAPLNSPPTGGIESRALALTQQAMNSLSLAVREHPDQWWPWASAPLAKP